MYTIALVGNPNTGKTTLFNALTGYHRHVANYPGVTVDAARGPLRGTPSVELLDLPGTYSLSAQSPDEQLVSSIVRGTADQAQPDALLIVLDAGNLARNLYLATQLLELNLPTVLAVNMVDVAEARGLHVDCDELARRLGVPVLPVIAIRDDSLARLKKQLAQCRETRSAPRIVPRFDDSDSAAAVRARYQWIGELLTGVLTRPERPVVTWSDRIDRVLMGRLAGSLVLLAVLFVVFQSIFSWAAPLMDAIDAAFGRLSGFVAGALPDGALRSLICDGLIGGVGGVLVFLPQILILFAFIAILEDCGYMSRAAHLMDRLMRVFGLSGRAFIPLLSSFACAIPAILGTRTIPDRRERLVTILLAPFMSCSARLPVYVLMISAFVPPERYWGGWLHLHALVMLGMYVVGVLVAAPLAWLLRSTVLAGPPGVFLLELPSYKWPRWRAVWQRMAHAGKKFVVSAGTVIVLVNLVVWVLGYFPRSAAVEQAVTAQAAAAGWDEARFDAELAGAQLRDSYLGRAGRAIEPLVAPLGWDWRIAVAVIASFPAREVVVATMGTIYNLGAEEDESSQSLRDALSAATWPGSERKVFTLPVALSLMVFFALCAQCSSTLVIMGRETRSWAWPVASFFGMTAIAYVAAWLTFVIARALT